MQNRRFSDLPPGTSSIFLHQGRRLGEALRGKGAWLWAQAGTGKTAVAASFLAVHELPAIWCRLGERIPTARSLYQYLRSELQSQGSGAGGDCLDWDESTQVSDGDLRNLCGALFRGISAPVALVFEDCHRVDDTSTLWQFMHLCFEEAPERVSFIFLSRHRPHWVFSSSLARRQLNVLRQEAFRLEESDAIAFLDQQYPELSSDKKAKIAQRCGG